MNPTAISIITVCRNPGHDIRALAESVLTALDAGDEWVVQDGASTDGAADWLCRLPDPRVRFETCPDQGIYDAMNRAVRRAAGDFILFLGADDRPRIRMDALRGELKDAHTVYYGDVWRVTSGDRYAGPFDGAKLARTNICQQAIFYPRAAFAAHRCFDPRYRLQADWVFNMACFADASLRFEYLDRIIADYGQQGQSSLAMDPVFQRQYRQLLKTFFSFRQRWRPAILSFLADIYRALPGVPAPRQTAARSD